MLIKSTPHASADPAGHQSTIAELSHDFRLANGRLARRLRQEKAANELSASQFSALGALFVEGSLTLSALSDREHVTPPSMSRTVNALVKAGLVHRAVSSNDARKVELTATEAGLTLMRETRRRRDAWLAQRVITLSDEQRQILAEATVIMRGLADS
ncbi:MarR family winged helix-turn-helix transcriptional regulator [Cryobacterium psychrophilum]|uniref:MarR family transcriptional regulator n=1 Tax=Cryobacterium psychrophilum TaxID=41988 RepID=A0A4Y8KM24_9MICO|nr:MarR family transcriptional regulator [Cryobacterium psychrophilum]TDW30321.1 DNA-binding MarR family transcriptional regulator [Cryobacterium psychrophilum]TFD77534.1 MarR family transcriptional regulator [Cryobacterium psychrophilum]